MIELANPSSVHHYRPPAFERITVAWRNWWGGAFGRRKAFIEGRDVALAHAAMIAHDMGRRDIADAIARAIERAGS